MAHLAVLRCFQWIDVNAAAVYDQQAYHLHYVVAQWTTLKRGRSTISTTCCLANLPPASIPVNKRKIFFIPEKFSTQGNPSIIIIQCFIMEAKSHETQIAKKIEILWKLLITLLQPKSDPILSSKYSSTVHRLLCSVASHFSSSRNCRSILAPQLPDCIILGFVATKSLHRLSLL
jgi:hypothetical protein